MGLPLTHHARSPRETGRPQPSQVPSRERGIRRGLTGIAETIPPRACDVRPAAYGHGPKRGRGHRPSPAVLRAQLSLGLSGAYIIDYRALEALGVQKPPTCTLSFWFAYVAKCRELASDANVDMRTLDRAMWQWSKERLS